MTSLWIRCWKNTLASDNAEARAEDFDVLVGFSREEEKEKSWRVPKSRQSNMDSYILNFFTSYNLNHPTTTAVGTPCVMDREHIR